MRVLKRVYKYKKITYFFPKYSNYGNIDNYYVQSPEIHFWGSTFLNISTSL